MLKKLVIIEDNAELIEYIKEFMKTKGDFMVTGYTSGAEALKKLKLNKPDILIIDLMLEDLHGETICREVRKTYADLPIIILTGDKSQASIISCLNSGADDYITKPFNADEFFARINARLRGSGGTNNQTLLKCKEITLNTETMEVFNAEEKIELTAKEYELLKYLMTNKARVLTRDQILYSVWGYSPEVDTRVVDVHVGKLRKKLTGGVSDDRYIQSMRGFGYKMLGD